WPYAGKGKPSVPYFRPESRPLSPNARARETEERGRARAYGPLTRPHRRGSLCGMSETRTSSDPGAFARFLARSRDRAALATSLRGTPYASLVLFAVDLDASPLLLLSDLAQHSRNIASDPRVSLLLDATEGRADPLTGPRVTLIGQAVAIDDPRPLARFIAHHPTSSVYSGFGDFRLYRVTVERG